MILVTCREKIALERPDCIDSECIGGVDSCPNSYGYMEKPWYCDLGSTPELCTKCWDREIPGAEERIHLEERRMNMTIKDSGNRTEFSSGAVRDCKTGVGRMDLLPWAAIMEVSKHCENGAKKYGEHNIDKGIPTHSLCDSAARHLAKYLDGWTDEPHLLAAAWNLLWAIQMEVKHPELCDIPFDKKKE